MSNCVFKMGDLWVAPGFSFYSDHIDLPVVNFMSLSIMFCRGEHVLLLPGCDCDLRRAEGAAGARFDFYKAGDAIFLGNNVNFSVRRADVARNYSVTVLFQVFGSDAFTPTTDLLVATAHVRNLSKIVSRRFSQSNLSRRGSLANVT